MIASLADLQVKYFSHFAFFLFLGVRPKHQHDPRNQIFSDKSFIADIAVLAAMCRQLQDVITLQPHCILP